MSPEDRISQVGTNVEAVIKDLSSFGKWRVEDVESETDRLRNKLIEIVDDLGALRDEVDSAIDEAKGTDE